MPAGRKSLDKEYNVYQNIKMTEATKCLLDRLLLKIMVEEGRRMSLPENFEFLIRRMAATEKIIAKGE